MVVAVICDVVSDLDKEDQAGLYGYDSDKDFAMAHDEEKQKHQEKKKQAIEERLQDLQEQIENMVAVQNQMRSVTLMLADKLRQQALQLRDEKPEEA